MNPTLASALHAHLLGQVAITNLIGTRLRPMVAWQTDALPYAVVQGIFNFRPRSTAGSFGRLDQGVQIDAYGATAASARAVAEAIRLNLENFRGAMGAIVIGDVSLDDMDEDMEPPRSGESEGIYRVRCDYTLHVNEPVAAP